MASAQRHRYGDPKVETMPCDSATTIEIGDLMWFDASANEARPAVEYTGSADLATTQTAFKKVFCGVARSAKRAADTHILTVQVQTSGIFEFPCASAAFDVGTFLAPAATAIVDYSLPGTLSNQKLVACATAIIGIGKPARQYTSAVTSLYARLESTIHDVSGGVQTIT